MEDEELSIGLLREWTISAAKHTDKADSPLTIQPLEKQQLKKSLLTEKSQLNSFITE